MKIIFCMKSSKKCLFFSLIAIMACVAVSGFANAFTEEQKQCYDSCRANGGSKADCAKKCD